MGLLREGQWVDEWYDTATNNGHFVRTDAQFRHWVTADGSPGSTGAGGFKAEAHRYHLYVSLACPWAHRTLIFRKLKGLEDMVDVSVVSPFMGAHGWTFEPGAGVIADHVNGARYLYQLYMATNQAYTGRVTVPILWDKYRETIVSNESADIIRMFNSAFNQLGATPGDYCPAALHAQIDAINEFTYTRINNGVYKAGFATTQLAYLQAVTALFEAMETLELRLSQQRYLVGDAVTETDWRLFTTLLRFDAVYHGHFKCNIKRLTDFPNLWAYTRELYQWPGIAETVDMEHIKTHYYGSHDLINPTRIVPAGPHLDFNARHTRAQIKCHGDQFQASQGE